MLAFFLCFGKPFAGGVVRSVSVEGTAFMVELNDGRILRTNDLADTEFDIQISSKAMRLRIDSVEHDSNAADIWLHGFSVKQSNGTWKKLCKPGPDGRSLGFPLAGKSRRNGTLDTTYQNEFELACTSGVQAKCLRYGYLPWSSAPDGSPLLQAFNACVLMLRADYSGDNTPTTRDGTKIDIADRWNIQTLDADDDRFEAGWDAGGAVCVHHARISENMPLEALEASVPRLKGRTGGICTPEFAKQHGALILNRSKR